MLIADDPRRDGHGWLRRAHELEHAADRVREQRWGPRTLDVDLVTCHDGEHEVIIRDDDLTLPHPLAHLRAFVLVPWLDVDPDATLTVAGESTSPSRNCSPTSTPPSARRAAAGTELDARNERSRLMGPTRKRDLTAATVAAAVLGYLLVTVLYRWFPPDHGVDRAVAAGGGRRRGRLGVLRAGEDQRRDRSATGRAGCIRWPSRAR